MRSPFPQTSKNQLGFTLIELVMVIVVLGVLSAFALPRFADLNDDAHAAIVEHLSGSLMASARLQNTKARIDSANGGLVNGYVLDGALFDQGYPIGVSWADSDNIPEILETMDIDFPSFTYSTVFNGTGSSGGVTRELYITSRGVIADGATAAQIIATGCYASCETYVVEARAPETFVDVSGC